MDQSSQQQEILDPGYRRWKERSLESRDNCRAMYKRTALRITPRAYMRTSLRLYMRTVLRVYRQTTLRQVEVVVEKGEAWYLRPSG